MEGSHDVEVAYDITLVWWRGKKLWLSFHVKLRGIEVTRKNREVKRNKVINNYLN